MGVPVVLPSKTPECMLTVSGSLRGVVMKLWPGLRRSSCSWMSASAISTPGVAPSTITPTAPPCDSPKVVSRKRWPKLLPAIGALLDDSQDERARVRDSQVVEIDREVGDVVVRRDTPIVELTQPRSRY